MYLIKTEENQILTKFKIEFYLSYRLKFCLIVRTITTMNQFTAKDLRELYLLDRDVATLIYNTLLHEKHEYERQEIQRIHDTKAKVMRLLPYHAWQSYTDHGWDDATVCRLDEGDYIYEDEGIIFVKRQPTRQQNLFAI